ncbi:Hint domain-containing protein [Acinetobacter tibetensis]|uniref:Hint domain-containing protein n=1 Tax=Acinetobacter tibetensis TaxID=2943497 RepID=A0AAE9LTU1_9GAMM|nr:Hint domain-containing protein [Acinetobacter tibetensis]USE84461.1 Hint domain-containing protein [Acinetobacter tibetensis]
MDNNIQHTCFVAGTLVHTNQGLIPIEQLKAGDLVLSKLANGELVYKPILRTIVTENVQVSLIELEQWVDPPLPMRERLNLRRLVN